MFQGLKKKFQLGKAAAVAGTAAALSVGMAGSAFAASPPPLPSNATSFQWAFMPHFDYDGDSCFPSAAIGPDGRINGGLRPSGSMAGGCRHGHLSKANTYVRTKCNHDWCGIVYGLYFEKDQGDPTGISSIVSHRHDWECAVVWVKRGASKPSYLSASRHGGFSTHPVNEVPMDGAHVKIVYHKDGGLTHAMRFAKWGEKPEAWGNGAWDTPAPVDWNRMSPFLKGRLTSAQWRDELTRKEHAGFMVKDGSFESTLDKAKPAGIPFVPWGAWQ
jgi:hypothetical protein